MKYLLDTCIITQFVKNIPPVVAQMKSINPDDLAISSISIAEIEYGLAKLEGIKAKSQITTISTRLLSVITEIPFVHEAAKESGKIRARLSKAGQIIGAYDILIAATAKVHGLVMVTSNVDEFSRIEELIIEDWLK